MPDTTLSPADAQAMQDTDLTLVWVVTHPDRWIARPHSVDHAGGRPLDLVLIASELDALRAMLPEGLQRDKPTTFWPPEWWRCGRLSRGLKVQSSHCV